MEADGFGWREGILLAAAAVAVYLAFLVLRLIALGRRRSHGRPGAPVAVPPSPGWDAGHEETAAARFSVGETLPREEEASPGASSARVTRADEDAAATPWSGGFGEQLAAHLAKSEMEHELRELRAEVERLRREVESLRERRAVSPQYAEALALIERGLSAQQVADELGISRAEAELVQALAQRRFDEERGESDDDKDETGLARS